MDQLEKISRLLELNTGNFMLSSSVDVVDVSFAASLFLDNSENGIALIASGKGDTVDKAMEELLVELD